MLSQKRRTGNLNPQGGSYLNRTAVLSPLGAVHLIQLALGCAVISLVAHIAGYNASYGTFCISVWSACFVLSAAIFILDVTRLNSCIPVSWDNLTVTLAASATLLYLMTSILYPAYFVSSECPYNDCEVRNFRIAVTVCSWATFVAYTAEVFLSRAKPGRQAAYMATPSGLLKVAQVFVGCAIFAARTEFWHHAATIYCAAVFAACLAATSLVVALNVCGPTARLRPPSDRLVALYAFAAMLLYLSAAVVWPIFCFDKKYGMPVRPQGCPRGKCAWDGQLVVTVFCFVNLALYIADLCYSQRTRFVGQHPRV
ncbi:myeloid-associated differentiation marker-like protein 2 [Salminus brasiliensis]|uniref:myeloid-associated differentiation marker-like protein 2 n=1 Tax=Salminus brasiliensis TaxID=930266 RepID=UPI003B834182